MTINRKIFFAGIRSGPFPGKLKPTTVRGVTAILDEWEHRHLTDLRNLAYMLATTLGECGENMLPVREGFRTTDAEARAYVRRKKYPYAVEINGQVYYGRGLVQVTWLRNYKALTDLACSQGHVVDFVANPDLLLDPGWAAWAMFDGMERGLFTKKKLSDYINDKKTDFVNARRIINGLDRAAEIASYAKQFYADLVAASS